MFNKNIIVGLVVIILLGGAIYYFSAGGNVQNLPVARSGELTRELAKQILLPEYKEPWVNLASYEEHQGGYMVSYGVGGYVSYGYKGKELLDMGLLSEVRAGGDIYNFTDEGKKYIVLNYLASQGQTTKNVGVILGDVKDIQITGINKKSDTEAEVEFDVEYALTPFGEVIRPDLVKTKSGRTLKLYDNGWRL